MHIDAHLSVDVPSALEKGLAYWIDKKIDWIFDTFKKPKLQYSGGTDSQTILETAYKKGHQFYSTWTQLGSITDEWFDYVDEEYAPAKEWLEAHLKAVKHVQFNRPSIEIYEKLWLNQEHPAFWIPGWHQCFKPVHRYLYLDKMTEYDCVVSGHFKPMLVKKGKDYYWWLGSSFEEYTFMTNDISFFGDGFIPEVAVAQAYKSKEFFETHLPNHSGNLSMHHIPNELRPLYHHYLGRLPAFNETIGIGTILGKSNSISVKNQRAMEEMIQLGRTDICEAWNEKRQFLIDCLRDVPNGFNLYKGKTPIDNYQTEVDFPDRIQRVGACFRLDPDGLVEISKDFFSSLM